jgi:competence protein ComFC
MFNLIKLFIKNIFNNLIEIIFPEFCVICGKLNTLLCRNCYETLEFVQFKVSVQSRYKNNSSEFKGLNNLNSFNNNLDSITCCCYYESSAKNLIHELKYNGVINVGKTIAGIIYYSSNLPEVDLITFVPIHKKKEKLRGFNQTEIIAKELGKLTSTPVARLLIKTKNTKSQMSLGKKENREENILDSIEINSMVLSSDKKKYKSILIVDDVFTSGTTLNYCSTILKNFGFNDVHGSCFLYKN